MNKFIFALVVLTASQASAVDEFILPDAANHVDLRHVKRSVCSIVYYDPPRDEYRQSGPGIGGDGGRTQGTMGFLGGQLGGWFGGPIGSRIGGFVGGYMGFSTGLGGSQGRVDRIHTPGGMRLLGSGVVYAETPTHYYILTAGHVVDRPCFLQFNYAGERSWLIPAHVIQKEYVPNTKIDLATIKLDKRALQGYPAPTIIPMPTKRWDLRGSEVVTVRYGSITHTKVVAGDSGSFDLAVKIHPGNSGSPVFDKQGKYLLGLVLQLDGTCINYINIGHLIRQHNEQVKKN